MLRIAIAALASALMLPLLAVAVVLLAAGQGGAGMGLFIGLVMLVVIAPHVLLLGVPAFLLLRRTGRLRGRSMALAGFVAGALPLGLYSWPYWQRHPGHTAEQGWHGRLVTVVRDGDPTVHGVLVHLESMFILGLLGMACALVFWFCWLYLQRRAGLPAHAGGASAPTPFPGP